MYGFQISCLSLLTQWRMIFFVLLILVKKMTKRLVVERITIGGTRHPYTDFHHSYVNRICRVIKISLLKW